MYTSSSSTKVFKITSISHVKTSHAMKGNLNNKTKSLNEKQNNTRLYVFWSTRIQKKNCIYLSSWKCTWRFVCFQHPQEALQQYNGVIAPLGLYPVNWNNNYRRVWAYIIHNHVRYNTSSVNSQNWEGNSANSGINF